MRVAKRYVHDTVTNLTPTTGGSAMPFGSVYMLAGTYTLGGQSWDCTQPGLYRFMVEGEMFFRNRIVVDVNNLDMYALMSSVCWNHIHDDKDETTDWNGLHAKGRYQKWRLRCGFVTDMMVWLFTSGGLPWPSRKINVRTLGPLNGADDGHIVIETLHGSDWRMWDLTNGCYWRNSAGKHLSATEFIAHIANNGPMPTKVLLDGTDRRWNTGGVAVSGGVLDYSLYGELIIDADPEAWFRRIFQAI